MRHLLKGILLASCLSLGTVTTAASVPETPSSEAPVRAPAYVALETDAGRILVELDRQNAPLTSENFLRYVDQKRLDSTSFYRALKLNPEGAGLIQGGVRGDPKRTLPPVKHEPTSKTGLSHVDGAISMARAEPGTATADFFIITGGTISGLDANPDREGDNQGFAVFGRVVDGMEVVRKIIFAPVSPTEGEGAMKGQIIEKPIAIRTARRAAPPPVEEEAPTDQEAAPNAAEESVKEAE